MLKPGDKAPAFALPDESGATVKSGALKGKPYVLYFYPKDDTPGCTKEACGFRDAMPDFGRLGVPVFGVSADSVARHRRFVDKYGLNFSLLSDEGHQLLEAYGVWVEKSMYGRKYFGIQRASFIVGADGRITHAWEKVKPEGHAEEVMAALRGQGGGKAAAAKQPSAKKAAAKQPAAARPAPKKAAAKKAATKKAGAGKAPAKKAPAKKAPAVKRAARAGGRGR